MAAFTLLVSILRCVTESDCIVNENIIIPYAHIASPPYLFLVIDNPAYSVDSLAKNLKAQFSLFLLVHLFVHISVLFFVLLFVLLFVFLFVLLCVLICVLLLHREELRM